MDLGRGDTDTQACIKCCFRRDAVKSINEKWQLQCKKVGPERTHRMLQKRHRQDFTLELAGILIVTHVVCLFPCILCFRQSRQTPENQTCFVLLKRRWHTHSLLHFKTCLSLSGNPQAENHGKWEE